MTTRKNHARAPGKQQRTIAVDKVLMDKIIEMAAEDRRTVNGMICKLLWDAVRQYETNLGNPERTQSSSAADVAAAAAKTGERKCANGATEGEEKKRIS